MIQIVPTLQRGNASCDAPRHPCAGGTRSVKGGIPTRSVGTINTEVPASQAS
ncbi:DUF1534 domain-containing protein [Pseudomonas sp. CFSAN084952]|nr:hypothetical protein DBR14_06010 [Pseudomonas sp. HMWF034]PVV64209.1 DUF1534 domain-containing protein [Pseudomonas sp. HMWF011]QGF97134.1 DUF1534 domain-containing protein [Pseudomonas sp. CFSAN084952]